MVRMETPASGPGQTVSLQETLSETFTTSAAVILVNLSSYSPDFNPDQAIWGWARQEMTANLCLGTRAAVRESVRGLFTDLSHRREEVKRPCRAILQARAVGLTRPVQADLSAPTNVDFTLAPV